MSYLKLFKVTQDFWLGKQSVNQAFDNNQALFDLYDAKHANGVSGVNTGGFSNPFRALGRHDDPLIARTVARFLIDRTNTTPLTYSVVSGPMLSLSNPQRIGAGQWRIHVYTPQLFGAVALVEATATSDRKATCFVELNPATGPSVVVSTWNVSSAALDEYDFSLMLWADSA